MTAAAVSLRADVDQFHKVFRQLAVHTSRGLDVFTNSRMSFLLRKSYENLKPPDALVRKEAIKAYLAGPPDRPSEPVGPTDSGGPAPRLIYLLVQRRQQREGGKGLYGIPMRKAVAKFRRRALGSVGYLSLPVGLAWKSLSRFTQGGTSYEGVRRRRGAKGSTSPARAGWFPEVAAQLSLLVQEGQADKVEEKYYVAFQRAFRSETAEMEQHLSKKLRDAGRAAGIQVSTP